MTSQDHLSKDQRRTLASQLQTHLDDALRSRATQAQGRSQAELAREVLMQDADDASQRAGAHEVDARLADLGSAELDALAAALQRIHGVGYGICADCQMPIPFERLSVEPQALRCTACQTLHERKGAAAVAVPSAAAR